MTKIEKLYADKEAAYRAMRDIREKMDADGNFADAAAETTYRNADAAFTKADQLLRDELRFEQIEKDSVGAEMARQERTSANTSTTAQKDAVQAYADVFMRYLQRGVSGLNSDEVRILEHRGTDPQITTTDSKGGFLVPQSFSEELTSRMLYYGGMLQACRIYSDTLGGTLEWPTGDDTSNTGSTQTTEGSAVAVQDMSFGQVLFGHYTMTSNIVKVSRQLVQDERVGLLTGVLTDQLGERLGRRINTALTNGTGTNAPYGLTTCVTNRGKEAASRTEFTKAELIDMQHSVDRAYRGAPNVGWMMNDTILAAARKLDVANTDTVQIFYPGLAVGEPDRLLGQQIWINNDLAGTQAQSAKIIYYGDFSKYVIRQIKGIAIERNDTKYWDELNVAFMGWTRLDGNLIDAQAIKFLQNKTT